MLYGYIDKLTCYWCGGRFAPHEGGRRCGCCNRVACPFCIDKRFGDSDETCVSCQDDYPERLERELERNQWGVTDTAPRQASADRQLPPERQGGDDKFKQNALDAVMNVASGALVL